VHTPLLVPGQNNRSVYITLSGTVLAHRGEAHRPPAPVTIPHGQCIGELSAIDGKPVSTRVMATTVARTMGLSRVLAMGTMEPHTLMSELFARRCDGNEANIFVTMFCGIVDMPNRRLRCSNANGGHCAPMLLHPGGSRMLPIPKGSLVGAFPGCRYSSMDIRLGPDETLFCCTDGATEAHNHKDEEFAEERCLQLLTGVRPLACGDLLDHVRARVSDFTETAVLEDDCTMLALRLP